MNQPRRVFNVDGSKNRNRTLTHYCLLYMHKGNKEHLEKFYIAGLGGDRTIFRYPWLQDFNPAINWDKGRALGPPVEVETALLKWTKK